MLYEETLKPVQRDYWTAESRISKDFPLNAGHGLTGATAHSSQLSQQRYLSRPLHASCKQGYPLYVVPDFSEWELQATPRPYFTVLISLSSRNDVKSDCLTPYFRIYASSWATSLHGCMGSVLYTLLRCLAHLP